MPNFKAGDKVELVNGEQFSNREKVATVKSVNDNGYGCIRVHLLETNTHVYASEIKLHEPAIKAGDKVERKNGATFSNHKHVVTVEKVTPSNYGGQNVWFKETGTYLNIDDIVHVAPTIGPATDNVNKPAHYTTGGIETIDFMRAKLTADGYVGYLQGNIIKYITRFEHKNGVEDLKKAEFYLRELIAVKEGN